MQLMLTHLYKLDLAVGHNGVVFKKKLEDIKTIVILNPDDSVVIYDDFAFRIISNTDANTTTIHSSKPLYIDVKDEAVYLDF